MLPQNPMQSYPQPFNTQLYNHQMSTFPQSYITGSPASNLSYQYPGYLMQYPSTALTGVAGYPAGYGPGFNGIIPTHDGMYVTSMPGYASPKPSASLRNSNVGVDHIAGSPINKTANLMEIHQSPINTAIINQQTVGTNPALIAGAGTTRVQTVGAGIANQAAIQQLQIAQNTIALQGFSQIQYVPYQSYYIDYQQRQFVQNVMVPVERKITDYYAVEHVVDYVPKEIEETVVEYIPQEKMGGKLYYVPVQTKLVHLPHHEQEHRTATATQQVHKTVTTTTQQQQQVVLPGATVIGQERVISRPVQQVIPRQELIQGLTNQLQRGSGVRSATQLPRGSGVRTTTVSPPKVQPMPVAGTTNIVMPSIPQQRPPSNLSPPKPILQPPTSVVLPQQPSGPLLQAGNQQTIINQNRPIGGVVAGGNQFQQSQQYIQSNLASFQQQMKIPDSAKVAYQYSTKSVRNLSPGEVPNRGTTTNVGQPIPGPIQTLSGGRPIQGQSIQGQPRPGPTPVLANRTSGPSGPAGQAQVISSGFQSGQVARTQVPPQTVQPKPNPTLMTNNKVDLADSEHIDITKSVFNATYGDSSQPTQQVLRQGSMTGTNAAIYTSGAGQSSNTFSFGQNTSSLVQPYDSVAANTNVNRSSGTFANTTQVNASKQLEGQANRISGGSVYDYDQLRDY